MFRDRISNTKTSNKAANKLKQVMLDYHDFCAEEPSLGFEQKLKLVTDWQSARLKQTHQDLYKSPQYAQGLEFLLSDLYSTKSFNERDKGLERIFPKIISLMPQTVIATVALLVELNLLTKMLDHQLTHTLFNALHYTTVDEQNYIEAYRHCNNKTQRTKQIKLISDVGKKLDRYARSSLIQFSLKITATPAEKAGLEALHSFIMQGFSTFHRMDNVEHMMQTLVDREIQILDNIYQSRSNPFDLTPNT